MTRDAIFARIVELIAPLNKKGVPLTETTSFSDDLEMDSLTVMDLVANIEDEWDIVLPLNMLPELETVGQVADAVAKLAKMIDLLDKFDAVAAERQALARHRRPRSGRVVMSKVQSPTRAVIAGRETILIGTYNYMGMTFDPDVIAAGEAALRDFGAGTTGSRSLNGTYASHSEVRGRAEGLLRHHARDGLLDRLSGQSRHHLDARRARRIRHPRRRQPRLDLRRLRDGQRRHRPLPPQRVEDLDKRLGRLPPEAGKLVVLEGVYSMLGDIAPLGRDGRRRQGARRDGAGRRGACDGLLRRPRPRRLRGGGRRGRGRFHHRHLLQVGRHGRRLLRVEPSEVRGDAPGLPPVHLHRLAAARGRRVRGDVDPQADAQPQQAPASVGEHPRDARRACARGASRSAPRPPRARSSR